VADIAVRGIPTPKEFKEVWLPRRTKKRARGAKAILQKARKTLERGCLRFETREKTEEAIAAAAKELAKIGWTLNSKNFEREYIDAAPSYHTEFWLCVTP